MNKNKNANKSDVVEVPKTFGATLRDSLLDSNLIVTTNKLKYDVKIINCNNYIQVYFLPNKKIKNNNSVEISNKKTKLKDIDTDNLVNKNSKSKCEIAKKNIIRSKLECQRLAKCNCDDWKTFITLTFAENVKDIEFANKKFRYFIDKIKRIYKDLKYIGIPEFQKRGATHYHLLTNISIDNTDLIYNQENNSKFKHIKYWNEGFTKVDNLNNDIKKIIGYISKYMTKDIDNRLYNRHRYFKSQNLKKPTVSFLNLSNNRHSEYYNKLINTKSIIYENQYINPYNNDTIIFKEFL